MSLDGSGLRQTRGRVGSGDMACPPPAGDGGGGSVRVGVRGEKSLLISFLVPALVVLVIADLYPLLYSAYLSVTDWSMANLGQPVHFTGLANYIKVLKDEVFRDSFLISGKFALAATSIELALGLLLAYMLVGEGRTLRVVRTMLIIPMLIPGVVVGTIWRMMLNTNSGLVNYLLGLIGLHGSTWFSAPSTALWSTVLVDIWYSTPFVMITLVAGISSLPGEPVRAAMVDGASRFQVFRYIMIPMLAPVITLVTMFRMVDSFFVLDHIYTTTFGGPGFSTNVVTFQLYKEGLRYFNLPTAAAGSWMMVVISFVVVLGLTWLRGWLQRRAST